MLKFHQIFLSVTLLSLSCANNLFSSQLNCQRGDLRQRQVITGLTASDSTSSASGGIARSTMSMSSETRKTSLSASTIALLSQDSVDTMQEAAEKEAKEKQENVILVKKAQRSCCGNLFAKCCLQATCRGLSRAYGWCKEKVWSAPKNNEALRELDEKAKKEQQQSLAAQIGLENQKSFRGKLGANPVRSSQDDPYAYYEYKRTMIYTPADRGNAERSFSLLACAEAQWKGNDRPDWLNESVIDRTVWVDLNLFSGSLDKPDVYVGSLLGKYVVSGMGKAYLCGLLGRPTDRQNHLESRQKIVRTLSGNLSGQVECKECSQDFEALKIELKVFAEHEKFLTEFLDEKYPRFVADLIDYYQIPFSSYLNRSATALEIKAFKSYVATTANQVLLTGAVALLPYGLWELSSLYSNSTSPDSLDYPVNLAAVTAGGLECALLAYTKNHLVRSTLGIVGLLSVAEAKRHLLMSHANLLDHDLMRKVLMHTAQVTRSIKRIHTIIKRLPEDVRAKLTFFDRFDREFINANDKDVQQLLSLLDSKTFAMESDDVTRYAYSYGRVLCAWKLLRDCRDKFALPLAAIGEIDAYAGLAQLIMEKDSKFRFAQYITGSGTPLIQAKKFCSLFVNPATAVTNDISLGERFNAPNMILTGPNSAGKSMTVFGLVQQVVMAQSVGITLGEVSLTPFSNIETYRNISDSQVDQESRFQVEARRIKESINKIDELAKGQFKFTVFDELFSGTNPKSASYLTCRYAEKLGKRSNSLNIISTHFIEVTDLGRVAEGRRFVNYKVPVDLRHNPLLRREEAIRRYKLKEGVCKQDITMIVIAEIAEKENAKKCVKEIGTITGLPIEASKLIGQYSEGFTQEEELFIDLTNELLEKMQEFKTLDLVEADPIIQKRIEDLNSIAQKVGKVAPTIQELYYGAQEMKKERESLQFAEANATTLSLSSSSSSSSSATTMSAKTS